MIDNNSSGGTYYFNYWTNYYVTCTACGGNGISGGTTCYACNGTGMIYRRPSPPPFIPPYRPRPPYPNPYVRPQWVPQCTCGRTDTNHPCPVHPNIRF